MSEAHIEKFYRKVMSNQALVIELAEGVQTPEDFLRKAVELAREDGYDFTEQEAERWIRTELAMREANELSDTELENVAGGKGASSLSDMGEIQSLRLQMSMERSGKMTATLSNILKKISDTSQTIVGNMK